MSVLFQQRVLKEKYHGPRFFLLISSTHLLLVLLQILLTTSDISFATTSNNTQSCSLYNRPLFTTVSTTNSDPPSSIFKTPLSPTSQPTNLHVTIDNDKILQKKIYDMLNNPLFIHSENLSTPTFHPIKLLPNLILSLTNFSKVTANIKQNNVYESFHFKNFSFLMTVITTIPLHMHLNNSLSCLFGNSRTPFPSIVIQRSRT